MNLLLLLLFFCGASGPKTWNFLLEINSTAIFCVVSIRSGIVEDVYAWSLWQRVLRMLQETLSLLMTLRRYTAVQFIVLHNSHSELCLVREKVLAQKPIFCVVLFFTACQDKTPARCTSHDSWTCPERRNPICFWQNSGNCFGIGNYTSLSAI